MRTIALLAIAASTAVAACSSSPSSPGSACTVEGTYSAVATSVDGTCPAGGPTTVTITARPPGATDGPDYAMQVTGRDGLCALNRTNGAPCKVQGECTLTITDAIDPGNAIATKQYAWTFTAAGFEGTTTSSVPPARSAPSGCQARATVEGTRE